MCVGRFWCVAVVDVVSVLRGFVGVIESAAFLLPYFRRAAGEFSNHFYSRCEGVQIMHDLNPCSLVILRSTHVYEFILNAKHR